MMNATEERLCQTWYYYQHWTPEEVYRRRTRWNNLHHNWTPLELAVSCHYEQYYNERRAREAVILPDGVAE